jgi:hypothetical protein
MSGNSYQKNGGVGVYHEIPNGTSGPSGTKKKTIIAAVVVVAAAVAGYVFFGVSKPAGASVAKVMEKANLEVNSKGKLKLFDKLSTLFAASIFGFLSFNKRMGFIRSSWLDVLGDNAVT